jgi:nitronate monooxygenase
LAAALMLGADGVVVGTRFWAAAEALTPMAATERAIHATGDDTVRTKALDALRGVPWPEEFSFRVVKNKFTEQWADREAEAEAAFGSLAEVHAEARRRGNFDIALIVAGECVGLIQDRPGAASILQQMVTQAQSVLRRGATLDFI